MINKSIEWNQKENENENEKITWSKLKFNKFSFWAFTGSNPKRSKFSMNKLRTSIIESLKESIWDLEFFEVESEGNWCEDL